MQIHGLQKMTLLDYPGRVACTVFLAGCDFRCPFCHNSGLISPSAPAVMDERELTDFLRKRKGLIDAVCFTGGEPLLRDLLPLISEIKDLGYAVKVDTNGNHPDRLAALIDAGVLDYVAMDIKNDPARYALTCGLEKLDLEAVRESVLLIMSRMRSYEFRTTVTDELHDEDSFKAIGPWIRGAENYFIQPFTDRDTVEYAGFHAPPDEKLAVYADIMRNFVKNAEIRGRG